MLSATKLAFAALLGIGTVAPAGAVYSAPMSVPAPAMETQSSIQDARWVRRCNNNRCRKVWVGNRNVRPRIVVRPRAVIRPRVVIRPAPRVIVGPSSRVVVRPAGNRHVRWCSSQYRSYDRSTDTFVTYGGEVKRCVSPYR